MNLLKWGSVFATSVLELWAAIPLGFALGLHPVTTGILSALGSIASAFAVILIGGPIRRWLLRRWERKTVKQGRLTRIWDKYGVVGLGLASPLITGAPLGAVIGVSLGADPARLLVWMTAGILVWTVILTAAVALGIAGFLTVTP